MKPDLFTKQQKDILRKIHTSDDYIDVVELVKEFLALCPFQKRYWLKDILDCDIRFEQALRYLYNVELGYRLRIKFDDDGLFFFTDSLPKIKKQ